jgi:hypothetical protein
MYQHSVFSICNLKNSDYNYNICIYFYHSSTCYMLLPSVKEVSLMMAE